MLPMSFSIKIHLVLSDVTSPRKHLLMAWGGCRFLPSLITLGPNTSLQSIIARAISGGHVLVPGPHLSSRQNPVICSGFSLVLKTSLYLRVKLDLPNPFPSTRQHLSVGQAAGCCLGWLWLALSLSRQVHLHYGQPRKCDWNIQVQALVEEISMKLFSSKVGRNNPSETERDCHIL